MSKENQTKTKPISYRVKENTTCRICKYEFQREQLHSGGGRLIAGKLTVELRRLYEISKKYGRVYPQAYAIQTCPSCLFSSFPNDFKMVAPEEAAKIKQQTEDRKKGIQKIVGPIDFHEDRNLVLGAASYILAIDCYQNRGTSIAPTPKKAICGIRGAWLFDDMNNEFPDMNFDKIRDFLYIKTLRYYGPTLEIMSSGREPHEQFQNLLGPDTDQNYSFDGVIYLNGYLTNKYLDQLATEVSRKIDLLDRSKRYLGKLYGMEQQVRKPQPASTGKGFLYIRYGQIIQKQTFGSDGHVQRSVRKYLQQNKRAASRGLILGRHALIVEYDGRPFYGFQIQAKGPTIQKHLEETLSAILREPIRVLCAGRTDSGVHATGQVVSFSSIKEKDDIDYDRLIHSANGMLPTEISIRHGGAVPPDFHARYTCVAREYEYLIWN